MRWAYKLQLRFRSLFRKGALEGELDDELRFHLEKLIEQNVAAGMAPEAARHAAFRELGGMDQIKEECRDMRRVSHVEHFVQDVHYGFRQLRHNPGFATVTILTLALGIGANTTIFSLLSALLLTPLPGRDPGRLVTAYTSDYSGPAFGASSYPDYLDFRSGSGAFESLAACGTKPFLLTSGSRSDRILVSLVSDNFFDTLGLGAAYGRTILRDEVEPGRGRVIVVGDALWRGRFGADPALVGRSVALNGKPFTVVGIGPPGFTGLVRGVRIDAFVPITMDPVLTGDSLESRGSRGLFLIGRLRRGVAVDEARSELAVVAARLHAEHPEQWTDRRGAPRRVSVLPEDASRVLPMIRGPVSAFLGVLSAAVGLVLLIACSNIASLLLARGTARRREIAVRLALGARRSQLVRMLLTESLLLSLIAGALGVALAMVAVSLILALHPPLPFSLALGLDVDRRVLLFALLVSLATGVAFGILPALRASRTRPFAALKAGEGPARRRAISLRDALVVAQVAGSLVLLVGAALLLRSLARAQAIDPGFDPQQALVFSLDLAAQGYDAERGAHLYSDLQDRLDAMPGVAAASFSTSLPLSLGTERRSFRAVGYEPGPGEDMEVASSFVGADYFETMRTALARGRGFTRRDAPGTPPVAVVNEAFVRRFWPGRSGLGEHLVIPWNGGDAEMEVIGVARDGKYGSLGEAPRPYVFYPHRQLYRSQMAVVVRTSGDPRALVPEVRRQVAELDPSLAAYDVKTLEAHLGTALYPARAAAGLLALTGALALFLAAIGMYGVLSYLVSLRTHEIGVRMALGARRQDVVRLVVARGLHLALAGLMIGLPAAIGAAHLLAFLLYGTSPRDPIIIASVMGLLLGVAVASAWAPARRAASVEPMVALRDE
jgi:putative ABC transport system permease protein